MVIGIYDLDIIKGLFFYDVKLLLKIKFKVLN